MPVLILTVIFIVFSIIPHITIIVITLNPKPLNPKTYITIIISIITISIITDREFIDDLSFSHDSAIASANADTGFHWGNIRVI